MGEREDGRRRRARVMSRGRVIQGEGESARGRREGCRGRKN